MRDTLFLVSLIGLLFLSECHGASMVKRQAIQGSNSCSTPDGDAGDCNNIKQCPTLLELLKTSRNKPDIINFLRRSMCGYEGNDPKVCCPRAKDPTEPPSTGNSEQLSSLIDEFPNMLSPPLCGYSNVSQNKIVGGQPSELGAWPWISVLGYRNNRNPNAKMQWLCGAALVTNKHVITAAHCTKHPSLTLTTARFGDLDLDESISDGASPIEVQIQRALSHPAYNAVKQQNDIAILYLKETVQFNKFIQPICLPKTAENRARNFEKTSPFVAGWGSVSFKGPSSSRLQQIQIPVVENESCRKAYAPKGGEITPKQLCAGKAQGGQDACQGDSGGPLMWPRQGYFYLIGVVSYGYRCAEAGFPGIYARTTSYLDWINQNLV